MSISLMVAIICWMVALVSLALSFASLKQFTVEHNKTETGCIIAFFSGLIGFGGLFFGIFLVVTQTLDQ